MSESSFSYVLIDPRTGQLRLKPQTVSNADLASTTKENGDGYFKFWFFIVFIILLDSKPQWSISENGSTRYFRLIAVSFFIVAFVYLCFAVLLMSSDDFYFNRSN